MAPMPATDPFRLHAAAELGKSGLIKQYLAAGDCVDTLNEDRRTPLTMAICAIQITAARLLLAEGADPSVCDERGVSPLTIAAALPNMELAHILIQAGTDVNAIATLDGVSGTALYAAACNGDLKMTRLLLDAGCDVDRRLPDADPPLLQATLKGHSDVVDMIIAAGADVNASDCNGLTALYAAVASDRHDLVVSLLKKGANIDVLSVDGSGPMHFAAGNGFVRIVKALLEAGADPSRKDGKKLLTPLHCAAITAHHACAFSLLLAKADVSARDAQDATPLHHASQSGDTEMIELLLCAGADLCAFDKTDRTPLMVASTTGNAKAVDLLIEAGSDPNKLNSRGRHALFGVTKPDVIKVLVNRGGNAKVLDAEQGTALHFAGYFGFDTAALCALYKAGVDPILKDRGGKTAADLAREQGHEDAAKMIDLLIAKHQSSLA